MPKKLIFLENKVPDLGVRDGFVRERWFWRRERDGFVREIRFLERESYWWLSWERLAGADQ